MGLLPGPQRCRRVSRAVLWPAGFLLATLLMIPASRPFVDSIVAWTWDDAVHDYVPADGYQHRSRHEGWANTRFGQHGVAGLASVGAPDGPVVLIWGDSQVEAFQVADRVKLAQQVTLLSHSQATGIGIGRGGREIGDYLQLMPHYERLYRTQLHVIVLPTLVDAYPAVTELDGEATYAFPPHPTTIEQAGLRHAFAVLGLDFAWSALKTFQWVGGVRALRFRLGPVRPDANAPEMATFDAAAAEAIVTALRSTTSQPVLLLYVPTLPVIEAGGVRLAPSAAEAESAAILARACRRGNVAFVDLTVQLLAVWQHTGCFPRGFANGVPSQGHLNALGHRAAAEAILAHLATIGPEV